MSDDLGNPGEPVAEVDPDDLKAFWQETRNLQARPVETARPFGKLP